MTTLHDITSEHKSTGEPGGGGGSGSSNAPSSQAETPVSSSEAASNSSGPSSLAQESLSSASGFQGLSSKSSSGICADSAPGSPDKSYVNVDIPDLDDIISACANINLGPRPPTVGEEGDSAGEDSSIDRSHDQTFTSAADDTISEETHAELVEETLQTFKTCPALNTTQIKKTTTPIKSVPKISAELGISADSSVLPYVSFEESVLRKHQEKSEEFKSALASFQLSVTGTLDEQQQQSAITDLQRASPTPCIEIDIASCATTVQTKSVDVENLALAGSPFNKINELKLKEKVVTFDSPDVSFKEVSSFDATVLIDSTDTDTSCASITQSKLNETVVKSPAPLSTLAAESENIKEKEQSSDKTQEIVCQEEVLNKTQDIVVNQENVLNKTQDIVSENDLNKTQDIVSEDVLNKTQEKVLNKTQDIISENILNKTQDLVKQENVLNKTQDIVPENDLNKTQDIVNQNILNKTQDIAQEHILNKTQEIVQESVLNKTQDIVNQDNIFNKTQDIVKENSFNNNAADVQEAPTPNKNQSVTQEVNANITQDKLDNSVISTGGDNLNDTLLIVQKAKQHLTEVDALAKKEQDTVQQNKETENLCPEPVLEANKELKEQKNKIIIQEANSPIKGDLSVQNRIKSPDKIELVSNQASEELKVSTELVASTPFDKSSNKEPIPKPSSRRSALFSQDVQQVDNKEPTALLDSNRTDLESTLVINNLEEIKDFHDASFNLLPPAEPEYEAFKPQQQSTTLPAKEEFDLSEAALSVAKEIDASLEKIEENEKFVSATELFSDPAAFDFLNQLSSQTAKRGERYDSLFMKFDPLAQKLSMLPQKNLPTSPSLEEEEVIVKETKPVSPAAAANPMPTIPNMNTPKKNPALAAIDRLLFYSPTMTQAGSEQVAEAKQKKEVEEKQESTTPVPIVDEKMTKELELVRSTVLQLEAELEKQKKEHKESLEKQKAVYEEKVNSMQNKFTQMQSQLTQEVKCKDQMTVVVEEYEKSISRLIAEREKEKTNFEIERAKLQEELQVANQHLSNTEAAFTDVHSKYERLKNVVAAYKTNETVLKDSIADNQETIKSLENRYEQLKNHAMAQLEKANMELSAIRKQNDAEVMKLKALVRKAELKSKSLEETVEQKMHENKELTKIIDEMIARVD